MKNMEFNGGPFRSKVLFGLLIFGTMVLGACDSLKGSLSVEKEFVGKSTSNRPNCRPYDDWDCETEKRVTFKPGQYSAEISQSGRNEIQMAIKVGKNSENILVKVPNNVHLPEKNGEFFIRGSDAGQEFDLQGVVSTVETRGDTRRERQSCTYDRYEQVCWNNGRTVQCGVQRRTYFGYETVEYYTVDTKKDLAFNLLQQGGAQSLAHFSGSQMTSEKIYTYRGQCF